MIIASRMVRDRRRSIVWWSFGIVAYVLMSVSLYPSLKKQPSFQELAKDLPPAVKALFSISDVIPLTSPAGYMQGRVFGIVPVLFMVLAIGLGAAAIAGSEQEGTLELLLSNPVTRQRVLTERYLAMVAIVLIVTAVFSVSVVLLAWPFGALEGVPLTGIGAACVGAMLLGLLHGTLAFTVGAVSGRRSLANGVAAAVGVGGYLLQGLIGVSDSLRPLRLVTPWHWYLGRNMLAQGVAPDALLAPIAVCAVLFPVALIAFSRRDLR